MPKIGPLPTAPQWMQDYAKARGITPEQLEAARQAQATQEAPQPPTIPQSSQGGLWDWIHPQGTGVTSRGFNDIYPPVGR